MIHFSCKQKNTKKSFIDYIEEDLLKNDDFCLNGVQEKITLFQIIFIY